jgi:hypothetical protein
LPLVLVWVGIWSSASLYLVYRTRMLWPVIVGHGMTDVLASMHGPFPAPETPLSYAVVAVPMLRRGV